MVFEGQIVLDDAVVDDDDVAGAVAVRVGVLFGGTAVRGPARVADAVFAVGGLGGCNLRGSATCLRRAALRALAIAGHGEAGRIISAIFQPAQPINNDWYTRFLPT